ncbi:hypothetical protein CYMTET_29921 [Cymbomonas tetramitiformis]|uniref:tRNA-uridine aminocarboxypropyltransferase n=1 Tax=Cymbomonas tetramitiformis TaxID=36881 RepID=A0AAE0FK25_9CHLO|nr:hypothetical protein CYMTET_29921 [Cymbomonas tetramitiformis]
MEDLDELFQNLPDDEEEPVFSKRSICVRCSRPSGNSCLCPAFPAAPVSTRGGVIILQHPKEAKRRLSTVPIIQNVLDKIWVIKGRQFDHPRHPILDALLSAARTDPPLPIILLFPGMPPSPLRCLRAAVPTARNVLSMLQHLGLSLL